MLLWSFGTLENWQRTTKQRLSILYRPNEVQKLDIFRNKVFVHDNDRLYCKLRCNVISRAITQWHREWKYAWRQEVEFFGQTATNFWKERLRVLRGPSFPQISPKWKIISEIWSLKSRNLPQLRESCAPQHRNFLAGLYLVRLSAHSWCRYRKRQLNRPRLFQRTASDMSILSRDLQLINMSCRQMIDHSLIIRDRSRSVTVCFVWNSHF